MGIKRVTAPFLLAGLISLPGAAFGDDAVSIDLTLKDHKFQPSEIKAPSGKAITIRLKNEDDAAEEFDSDALRTEKVVARGGTVTIKLKPLAAGQYPFLGEYHADTAKGVLIVE